MRFQLMTHRVLLLPTIAAVFGLALAGCGNGSSPGKPSSSATSSTTSSSSGGSSAAESAIKTNWVAFFSSKTPTSKRVSLLENGSQFASLISAQATSSLASSASATVNKVTGVTASQATVIYSIDVAGTPALTNQKGVAVDQGGTWKVGTASFCGLLQLEKTSGLVKLPSIPSACSSAG
ncbi:MAG TPA: hypothetical protein VHY58_13235 [Streptosporangiaceae bacterium]|nr:hypothetical protein [Streptosporangiaceae bacterium]